MAAAEGAAQALVIIGATGDLARRMLFPSLLGLERDGLLNPRLSIFACGRDPMTDADFQTLLLEGLASGQGGEAGPLQALLARVRYQRVDTADPETFAALAAALRETPERVFYLSTSPSLYGALCRGLDGAGCAGPGARVVLEKPIGKDLASSRAVNEAVGAVFAERAIFRVDHYLGKETVQNLMALRFANTIFEPLWNARAIDHVQITVAETLGVGDRWDYYDEYGALRDMVQNHLLQLLCLVAMEPPARFDPDSVRNEKVKVLRSLRPIAGRAVEENTVRGQYGPGVVEGRAAPGYAEEGGRASPTETFVALRADVENWRWAGTPFFLRTGKRLPHRRTEIAIQFKEAPHSIFAGQARADIVANALVISLQPEEEISLTLMNKAPGLGQDGMRLRPLSLNLSLSEAFEADQPRRRIAYERLMLDALAGVGTLFVRRDEVEAAWAWIDPIIEGWRTGGTAPKPYAAGAWGPSGLHRLIEQSEPERPRRTWRD